MDWNVQVRFSAPAPSTAKTAVTAVATQASASVSRPVRQARCAVPRCARIAPQDDGPGAGGAEQARSAVVPEDGQRAPVVDVWATTDRCRPRPSPRSAMNCPVVVEEPVPPVHPQRTTKPATRVAACTAVGAHGAGQRLPVARVQPRPLRGRSSRRWAARRLLGLPAGGGPMASATGATVGECRRRVVVVVSAMGRSSPAGWTSPVPPDTPQEYQMMTPRLRTAQL